MTQQDCAERILAVSNGTNIILAMLITELDFRGHLDKAKFASLLRDSVGAARSIDPNLSEHRMDLILLQNLANLLEQLPGWTPIVHEGGQSNDES